MTQVTESDYRTAQQSNARVRQEFLDAVNFEGHNTNPKVIYVYPNHPIVVDFYKKHNLPMEGKVMSIPYGPEEAVRIHVFRKAFDLPFNDFLNVLIHHEGHHVRQVLAGFSRKIASWGIPMDLMGDDYQASLLELPALQNQINPASRRALTNEELSRIELRIGDAEDSLECSGPYFHRNWKADLASVLLPSPIDDIVREKYEL